MPPALEVIDLDSDQDLPDEPEVTPKPPPPQYSQQALIPVIQRSSNKPVPARQYPDGPLPLRPSDNAPRKAHITGRVTEDDGVYYTLMVGSLQINEVSVTEVLQFVSPYELEEYENAQFIEEEENRKIAKAAEEADREAKRLRKLEKIRNKGIVFFEDRDDPESNEEGEVALGRHGRARPTYTHLYKVPGGGQDGGKRRRRKRDPTTGELMPLSDEDNAHTMGSSDDEIDVKRTFGRSVSQASPFVSGLELPKRRRRKRDPLTGELMPLDGDDNVGSSDGGMALQQPPRSSSIQMVDQPASTSFVQQRMDFPSASGRATEQQSARSSSILATQPLAISSPSRRAPLNATFELPKRRRRKRDPRTGELLPLDPEPQRLAATTSISAQQSIPSQQSVPAQQSTHPQQSTEERKKRPRRRRHPITGELMPLGWVYDPKRDTHTNQAKNEVPSMQGLSIDRESKRVRLTSDVPFREERPPAQATTSASSPQVRRTQVVELSDSSSEEEEAESSDIRLSIDTAPPPPPPKASTQIRSPPTKHGMMQRAISESSSNEPITLESFLSTTATGKANRDDDETSEDSSSEEEEEAHDKVASQKTSILNPMAPQPTTIAANNNAADGEQDEEDDEEDSADELGEGEFFIEGIHAHHLSDPRTHPGLEQVMLYQTKWEGWEEMTWEPAASFPDQSVVEGYRRRAGLKGRG